MTRDVNAKSHTHRAIVLLFGVFVVLIAFAALAQKLESDQMAQRPLTQASSSVTVGPDSADSHRNAAGNDSGGPPPLPLFLPAATYNLNGGRSGSIVVADVNHDGNPDIIAATNVAGAEGSVAVLLGNGDGTLRPAVNYDSGGFFPTIAVADVNRDGKLDILVANEFGPGGSNSPTIGVLLGNGDGTFQPVVTYSPGAYIPLSIVVADLNGDGKPDLVVSDCSLTVSYPECDSYAGGVVSVLLGNGDGSFQSAVTYGSGGYEVQEAIGSTVAVADIDGDGKPDLIVANTCAQPCDFEGEGAIGVLLGNGDGTFKPAVTYDPGAYNSHSVAVADLSEDGNLDMVVANCTPSGVACGVGPQGVVSVLSSDGHGNFQPAVTYDSGGIDAVSIAVADLNGDGKKDLAVGNYDGPVGILLGNGDGTFRSSLGYEASDGAVAVGDLNRDGRWDLIAAEMNDQVGVLLHVGNKSTTTTLTSSPNPSIFGQSVFTATVSSGSGAPSGVVYLYDGSGFVGSATLVGGEASISSGGVGAGSNSMTAAYQGSLTYHPSLSRALHQTVTPATTSISLITSVDPGVIGNQVTYTASIASQYGGPAGGLVIFSDGGSQIGAGGVQNNKAVYKTKYNVVGTHTITAAYQGDANNSGSVSTAVNEQIDYPTTTAVMTSGSPSQVGQPVTFTATVTSKYGSIPGGEVVTFSGGGKTLCSSPLSIGTATCAAAFDKAKSYTVKAQYAGDARFRASMGRVVQVVNP